MFDGYIIFGTPRTGSTLLCDLLAATKVAGNPDSYFMRDIDPRWAAQLGLPSQDSRGGVDYSSAYLRAVIKAGKADTSIFGLRLMRADLEDLAALIDEAFPMLPSDKARLEKAFGNLLYIHLARDDKLAQAISMVKAEQTGLWHIAPDGSEIERLSPPRDPEYDFDRIARKLAELEQYDTAWLSWFDRQGIEPLRVGYERLAANPAEVLTLICAALNVPAPDAKAIRPGVAKLADETSLDWMRRYKRDAGSVASR